jgi:hypothetical protein
MVQRIRSGQILFWNKPNQRSLVRNCEHYLETIMTEDTTTSEQLAEIEGQATEFTPPEGWRLLEVGETLQEGDVSVRADGHWCPTERVGSTVGTKQRYIRPIDPQPQPAGTADELRSEVSYVQNLLGTEKRRVVELEELVTSLQREVAVVKEELTTAAAVSQQLQIELDAAQQVPADSPELQQLRLRLADMTLDRDQCKDAYDRIFADLCTIKETTKAEAVEAIVEWLEPVRATIEAADNVQQTMRADNLACDIIRNLPGILRYVVGLDSPEDVE